jgi:hypothetical protein
MTEPTITVSDASLFEVGNRISIYTSYTPQWLLWRRNKRMAWRIEKAIRKVCRWFGYEIWPPRSQEFTVTGKSAADSTLTLK